MSILFNNHDISFDDPIISLFQSYINDYPKRIPETEDDYSLSCYIDECKTGNEVVSQLRDKATNKKIVLWTSPKDKRAIEHKQGLLSFFSEAKEMNNPDFYKQDGEGYILLQAILLNETKTTIEVASYFAELFYAE